MMIFTIQSEIHSRCPLYLGVAAGNIQLAVRQPAVRFVLIGEQDVARRVHFVRHPAKGVVTPRGRLILAVQQF